MARTPDPLRDDLVEKLKVLTINDGDLLVLSLAPNTFLTDRAWRAIHSWLKETGRENVRVLDIGPGGDALLSEDAEQALNAIGFYRLSPCDVCGEHPAPHEKIRTEYDEGMKATVITVRRYCGRHNL